MKGGFSKITLSGRSRGIWGTTVQDVLNKEREF
jgi:hypothetical protein